MPGDPRLSIRAPFSIDFRHSAGRSRTAALRCDQKNLAGTLILSEKSYKVGLFILLDIGLLEKSHDILAPAC